MSDKNLPFLPYGHQWISDEDIAEVVSVLKSDWLSQGPMIEKFEQSVADYVGAKYAVAFSNGTAALHGAMHAAGLGAGDKAITTPMTFAATSNAMLYVGAKPIFCDIERSTFCIDPAEVEKKMSKEVKVIAPVSFAGYPVDIATLREIAGGAIIIEDGCHALGAERNGKKIGAEADMTAFSFHPVKHITTGEGGMVTTNNAEFARKMRLFRSHGITRSPADFEHKEFADCGWYHEMQELGYNYRLTDFQCVLGASQMKRLPEFVKRRREIAALYNEKFADTPHIELPPNHAGHSWHLYPLWVEHDKRKSLFDHLRKNNIGVQVHYIPVPLHPYYKKRFGFIEGMFPEAERMAGGEISLPMFPAMTDSDVERVCTLTTKFCMGL